MGKKRVEEGPTLEQLFQATRSDIDELRHMALVMSMTSFGRECSAISTQSIIDRAESFVTFLSMPDFNK